MIKLIQVLVIIALFCSCGRWWPGGDDKSSRSDKSDERITEGKPAADQDVDRIREQVQSEQDLAGLGLTMNNLPQGGFVSLEQIRGSWFNPVRPRSCSGFEEAPGFVEAIADLGGIRWGYGIQYYQNERLPYLYGDIQKYDNESRTGAGNGWAEDNDMAESVSQDTAKATPLPDIARADLIGRHEDRVIFLSKRYGLFFVTVPAQGTPTVSCSVMVPGDAKNFYVHNSQLFLIVNSAGGDKGGVIRYDLGDSDLSYSGHRLLTDHSIIDSRRFNDSLALYTSVRLPADEAPATDPEASVSNDNFGAPADEAMVYQPAPQPLAYALTVLDLSAADLAIQFEELFVDETEAMDLANLTADPALIGEVVDKTTSYNNFLSASGRFLVISKTVNQRVITELRDQQHSATYCVKSHRQERRRTYCRAIWETVANPDYDPDFSCTDMATFDSCVANNKSKFVRSYSHYRGKKCEEHRYFVNVCDAYETKRWTTTHPVTEDRGYTDMIVYEFADGAFRRLGGPDLEPISQPGRVLEHKSFQFRGDYLYVATTRGLSAPRWRNTFNDDRVLTKVQAYLVQDGIFAPVGDLDNIGEGMYVSAVLFSDDSLFLEMNRVQYPYYPYGGNKGGPLYAIDLSMPQAPTLVGTADSNGYSTQLIAVGDRLLGVGQTPDRPYNHTNHARTALYDISAMNGLRELDQLAYMTSYRSSQNGVGSDDQVYHLDAANKRLVMPVVGNGEVANEYEGFICDENLWVTQNQITITKIDGDVLVAEAGFNTNQKVERSLALGDDSIVSFSDAAVYHLTQGGNSWNMNTVQEELVTEGIYRDPSLPEGMVIARQSLRNGWRLVNLRFVLGTISQIETNTATIMVDVPANMIACLGEPQRVSFHDDNIVVKFRQIISKDVDESTVANIDYTAHLAWQATATGFNRLPDELAKELGQEVRKSCYLVNPLTGEASDEEIAAVLGNLAPDQLKCWEPGDRVDFVGINPLF